MTRGGRRGSPSSHPTSRTSSWTRWVYLGALMIAGESIYLLPYMRKTFQTSLEAVFDVTSAELGTLNAMFGILAVLCYFPGGWLADRFSARHLLALSLWATGAGGFSMLGSPGYHGLLALHAFWGVTTILTFWAALIKATRLWGASDEQGRGFGLLDGGRGVVAALLASLATYLFAQAGSTEAKLERVLWVYTVAPVAAGGLVWFVVPTRFGESAAADGVAPPRDVPADWRTAARRGDVWLLAAVIFAAYWLYLGSFEFPAYAERARGRSKEFGAVLGTARDWVRPVAAVAAGFLADRWRSSRVTAVAFALLVLGYGSLWLLPAAAGGLGLFALQVGSVALAVFALRGIYYALMEETGLPRSLTGVTVGFVSVVGFLPDTFAFALSGWITSGGHDGDGYRSYFGLLTGVAALGLSATLAIRRGLRERAR